MTTRQVILRTSVTIFIVISLSVLFNHLVHGDPVKEKQEEGGETFEAVLLIACEVDKVREGQWICILRPAPMPGEEIKDDKLKL